MRTYLERTQKEIYVSYYSYNYSFDAHFHNKIELVRCVDGTQTIKIDNTPYTLEKGDVAVVFPNVTHEYVAEEGTKTETIAVIGRAEFFTAAYPELITKRPKDPIIKGKDLSGKVAHAFSNILESSEDPGGLIGWTYIVLSEVMGKLELVSAKLADTFQLAPSLVSYIDENFKKPLTIKYLANEFGYSGSYITHVFYDQLKIPFRTYLAAVRSEHAAMLIRSTSKNLTEIAYECGYGSTNTFCRCFKKHFGISPSEFKKSPQTSKKKST